MFIPKSFEFRIIPALLAAALCMMPGIVVSAEKPFSYFGTLQQRLIADGFDGKQIRALYRKDGIRFDTKGVSLYFVHNESKLNYDQFLEAEPIQKARAYMETHREALIEAEKKFGVHRHVITAILLVETRLGTYIGNRSVLNTLSTMAALQDETVKNRLWSYIKDETHLTREKFSAKANRKSRWAYKELQAFLKYTHGEKLNPLEIVGSYAGAMGFCQFMPSNILTLARDGNGDGRIDLFTHADAIMSIASYLNNFGWHSGIDKSKAHKVVFHYNHSDYYVNTVLKIADLLRS